MRRGWTGNDFFSNAPSKEASLVALVHTHNMQQDRVSCSANTNTNTTYSAAHMCSLCVCLCIVRGHTGGSIACADARRNNNSHLRAHTTHLTLVLLCVHAEHARDCLGSRATKHGLKRVLLFERRKRQTRSPQQTYERPKKVMMVWIITSVIGKWNSCVLNTCKPHSPA